jgi:hypothetical protein
MTRIAENKTSRNRAMLLRVLGAAIALIVIALGARPAAAANSPHHEFHNNVGLGGFCCAVIPGASTAPGNVIVVQTQAPAPPAPPRHTADQHFSAETQNDVEIVRGPPSLR